MNKYFFYVLMIFLFFSIEGIAQSKVLHGKITNEKDVEGVHILNTTSRFNAITNENGNFSIRVNPEDTLVFSSISYVPEQLIVSEEVYETGVLIIRLSELVNELDEVILGPNLSGNIATDVQNIKTEKELNFNDLGIPGFEGKGEEKIVPVAMAFFPTNVNLEAIYKYASGYYRKLKLKRKWESQNIAVAAVIQHYSLSFFNEAFQIPENRVYDFLLFCIETTSLQDDFLEERYAKVLEIFRMKGEGFIKRLSITPE